MSWSWNPQEMKAPCVGIRCKTGAWKLLPWARRGTAPPQGQCGGGGAEEFWGKHRQGEPSFVTRKRKGCSQKGPSGSDILLVTEHRVEGLRLVGEGSREGAGALRSHACRSGGKCGVSYGRKAGVTQVAHRCGGEAECRVMGRGQGSLGPTDAEDKVHFRPREQGSPLTPGEAEDIWEARSLGCSIDVLSVHSTAHCHLV